MIVQTEKLIAEAEEEVKILMSQVRLIPANLLKIEIAHLKLRVEAMKMANIDIVIHGLQLEIKLLSDKLKNEIHLLGFKPQSNATPDMILI